MKLIVDLDVNRYNKLNQTEYDVVWLECYPSGEVFLYAGKGGFEEALGELDNVQFEELCELAVGFSFSERVKLRMEYGVGKYGVAFYIKLDGKDADWLDFDAFVDHLKAIVGNEYDIHDWEDVDYAVFHGDENGIKLVKLVITKEAQKRYLVALNVRVPIHLHKKIVEKAKELKKTKSDIVREALEKYLQ